MATRKKQPKRKVKTFADLLAEDGRHPEAIAEACEVSRSYLYDLKAGRKGPPKPWTIDKIAIGLDLPRRLVVRAIDRTRKLAEAHS